MTAKQHQKTQYMCEVTNGKTYVADMDLTCYKIVKKQTVSEGEYFTPIIKRTGIRYEAGKAYHTENFERGCIDTDKMCRPSWILKKCGGMRWEKTEVCVPEAECSNPPKVFSMFSGTAFPIYTENDLKFTKKGFYSYTRFMNGRMADNLRCHIYLEGSSNISVIRCTIPKGSKYLVSDNGECFISENIVVYEEVDMTSINTAL